MRERGSGWRWFGYVLEMDWRFGLGIRSWRTGTGWISALLWSFGISPRPPCPGPHHFLLALVAFSSSRSLPSRHDLCLLATIAAFSPRLLSFRHDRYSLLSSPFSRNGHSRHGLLAPFVAPHPNCIPFASIAGSLCPLPSSRPHRVIDDFDIVVVTRPPRQGHSR
jgi:hypothetical protein